MDIYYNHTDAQEASHFAARKGRDALKAARLAAADDKLDVAAAAKMLNVAVSITKDAARAIRERDEVVLGMTASGELSGREIRSLLDIHRDLKSGCEFTAQAYKEWQDAGGHGIGVKKMRERIAKLKAASRQTARPFV